VEVQAYYANRVPNLRKVGAELRGPCPVHQGKRDSFAVDPVTGQSFCHSQCARGWDIVGLERELKGTAFADAQEAIFQIVGRNTTGPARPSSRRIADKYDYTDERGVLLYQVVRAEPKTFWQQRPDGKGGWARSIKGVRLVLYRLPRLVQRISDTVFVCEGERDVHSLESLGLLATCNPMGAGKWVDAYADSLRGRQVVIIPDSDPPTDEKGKPHFRGQKHAGAVAASLLRQGCEVRILELPRGKDASDWLALGGTLEELHLLISARAQLTPENLAEWRLRWYPPGVTTPPDLSEWPPCLAIQSALPPVKRFSEELLPASFRRFVRDASERMQVPMDYAAVAVVISLAGAVSRRAVIQPKANDTGWTVVPNLWGGIIGLPGFLKSPVIQAVTRPLIQIQTQWRNEYDEAMKFYKHVKEESELKHSAWKEQFKSNIKYGKATPERPADEPEEPKPRRLIVNDSTFEALHQTMSDNPAGILVVRDELTGWWSALDRDGREGERAFCLQAWNGDTGHTIDRIGRGTIHVEACCMSMLGGIQPGRLRSYLADALQDGPSNDGLIQRFQVIVWPDTDVEWVYVDRPPDSALADQVALIFTTLLQMDPAHQVRFRFAPQAQALFVEWLQDLESKVRGTELHAAMISHLSKYRSLMPALALLFELADRAAEGTPISDSSNFYVSLQHARQAAEWCDYLESHAHRIYSCVTTPQMRAAQELAEKIKTRKVGAGGYFTVREVYLKGWSSLDTPEAVRLAAQVLEDAGWIRALGEESSSSGGRPSHRYQIRPQDPK
jgi:putative DNA primase/helicase